MACIQSIHRKKLNECLHNHALDRAKYILNGVDARESIKLSVINKIHIKYINKNV